MTPDPDLNAMRQAIARARAGVDSNTGGPFGAVIVRDGQVIAGGENRVTSSNDPTAHAEVVAIREACARLGRFQLDDCVLYTSCEPCPMCLGAIYWAGIPTVYFAATRDDAAGAGFSDAHIYDELPKPMPERKIRFVPILRDEALSVFEHWRAKPDKICY